jgi:hypothetical protein
MISLRLAQTLKKAGLEWEPALHDMFAIPDRDLDDRRFVITEVLAYIEFFRGSAMVTFHGTAEWALDYILQTEAVWVPTETQLRELLEEHGDDVSLHRRNEGYECRLSYEHEQLSFTADDACDAYASALLQILWRQAANPELN